MAPEDDNAPKSGASPEEPAAGEQADNNNVGSDPFGINALLLEYRISGSDGKTRLTAKFRDGAKFERIVNVLERPAREQFVAALRSAHPEITVLDVVDQLVPIADAVTKRIYFDNTADSPRTEGAAEGEDSDEDNEPPQKDFLVELATKNPNVELFHTPGRHEAEPYASITEGDHRETWPVFSRPFRWWIVGKFHQAKEIAPGSQPLHDALHAIAAVAMYRGSEHPVFVRIAHRGDAIWLDLGDSQYRAVLVTKQGWMVVTGKQVPIRFIRRRGMEPLPAPVKGGSIKEFRPLVNVPDDQAWILLVTVLVSYLWPTGPYVILIVNGEQGSAKSTLCRFSRALIDPNKAPLRRPPKDDRDLMIAASNGWIVALDNLSGVAASLSDAICSLATGGGFATRELYTDGDEKLFDAMRPVMLNGISDLASRPDLLDRAVQLSLPTIPEKDRRDEASLHRAFEKLRPRLLGALLDAVSMALRRRDEVKLPSLPRMADFAILGAAAAPALGQEPQAFLDAYLGNRADAHSMAIESSAIGPPILLLLQAQEVWEGTNGGLLDALGKLVKESTQKRSDWPKSARGMREALARIAPNLRAEGIDVQFPGRKAGNNRERQLVLRRLEPRPSPDCHDPKPEGEGRSWDDRQNEDRPAESGPGNAAETVRDGRDGGDGQSSTGQRADPDEGPGPTEVDSSSSCSKVGEQPSPSSPSSRTGHGELETPAFPGRSRDGCPSEEPRTVPPAPRFNGHHRDDGDGPLPIIDQVLETFGGVEVAEVSADGNAPAPRLPPSQSPLSEPVSPEPRSSKHGAATPGFAFDDMDAPEVPYD
jgi:hypothetical protein